MAVTIKEVAKLAGVSIASVSYVINEKHKGQIGEEKYKKILAIAKKLNFSPSSFGRGLKLKKSMNIGYVYGLDFLLDPYFQDIIIVMEKEARIHGYSLLFFNAGSSYKELDKFFEETLKTVQVDGLIMHTPPEQNKNINRLIAQKFPLVFLGDYFGLHDANCVNVDNVTAGFTAAQHLIGLGKRNLCYLGVSPLIGVERLEGYKRALKANNIKVRPGSIGYSFGGVQAGYETLKKIAEKNGMPDGIVAHNDLFSMGALKFVMEQKKVRIPRDVAIVGFNNTYISQYSTIPITVVDIPSDALAAKAIEMLIDLLKGKEPKERKIIMSTQLIVRESSVKKR